MVRHRRFKIPSHILLIIVIVLLVIASFIFQPHAGSKKTVRIFHAGSLAKFFSLAERKFELKNPHIDVQREAGGSAELVRKITDLNKSADILCSSDYTLIDDFMIRNAKHADWNVRFVTNKIVIAYTENSKYHAELNLHNWFDILNKPDVSFGLANPNQDPCGYRALMAVQLAEIYYGKEHIFENLIAAHTTIKVENKSERFVIKVPANIEWDGKVMFRPKSVELVAHLQSGAIDYAFSYLSEVCSHKGLGYIELPSEIDLSAPAHKTFYEKVLVEQFSDTKMQKIIPGAPIAYGLTIPSNACNKDDAIEFIKFIFSEGTRLLQETGFTPLVPPETEYFDLLPAEIKVYVAQA